MKFGSFIFFFIKKNNYIYKKLQHRYRKIRKILYLTKNKKRRKCRDTIYRFSLKMKVLQSVSWSLLGKRRIFVVWGVIYIYYIYLYIFSFITLQLECCGTPLLFLLLPVPILLFCVFFFYFLLLLCFYQG